MESCCFPWIFILEKDFINLFLHSIIELTYLYRLNPYFNKSTAVFVSFLYIL